jgi:hypothetical protein
MTPSTRYRLLPRIEVDVRSPSVDRVGDDRVDELDDRRLLGGGLELDHLAPIRVGLRDVVDLRDRATQAGQSGDQGIDAIAGRNGPPHLVAGLHRDVVGAENVGRIGGRHEQGATVQEGDRNRLVSACLG